MAGFAFIHAEDTLFDTTHWVTILVAVATVNGILQNTLVPTVDEVCSELMSYISSRYAKAIQTCVISVSRTVSIGETGPEFNRSLEREYVGAYTYG
jgi:hypothetical protein